jgi:hypothetical protein
MSGCAFSICEIRSSRGKVGFFVPPLAERIVDQRPNPAKVIQSCDVFVEPSGLMYMTDTNAGLYILEYEGQL